jgi:hypothetical protein
MGSLGLVSFTSPERPLVTCIDNLNTTSSNFYSLEATRYAARKIFASNAYLSPDFKCQR